MDEPTTQLEAGTPIDTDSLIRQASALIARPLGRPTSYNPEIGIQVCRLLAQGLKTREIVAQVGISQPTVYNWLFDHEDFFSLWQRARECSVEAYADQNLEAADDTSNDVLIDRNGRMIPNMPAVKRSELRINNRQWLMGKWSKRYADKQQIEHSGTVTLEMATRLDTALRRLDVIDVQPEPAQSTDTQALVPVRQTYSPDSK